MTERKILIITDTHLTDNPSEEYRWKVFDFVKEELIKGCYTDLFHLGDVFDKKDKHRSELVNRVITSFLEIGNQYCPVTIMSGNHDYVVKRDEGFLRFLSKFENLQWIDIPTYWKEDKFLFLPHSRAPETEWEDFLPIINSKDLKFIFMHQSIIGVKVSNYHELNHGLEPSYLKNAKARIISGDIHLPQELNKVTYIGTQHPVSFGDSYQPRMLRIHDGTMSWIPISTIKREHIKMTIVGIEDLLSELRKLKPQDQVKVTLQLDKNQMHEWGDFKKQITNFCKENELDLHDLRMEKLEEATASDDMVEFLRTNMKSLSSKDVLIKFAQTEKIGEDLLNVGLKLFEGS